MTDRVVLDDVKTGVLEQKVWGNARHFPIAWHAAVSVLNVKEKTRSSWHLHHSRANCFIVTSGRLLIEVKSREGCISRIVLGPGEKHTVPALLLHRFRVLEAGQVVEVYVPDGPEGSVAFSDIARLDEGGADEQGDLMDAGVLL